MDNLERDILRSDPVLRWYLSSMVLSRGSPARVASVVLWLVVIPLALFVTFALITGAEHRFWLGSRDLTLPDSKDIVAGLSFLGDTMVWPFFFLVPLLLVLLRRAIGQTAMLFHNSAALVRPEVLLDRDSKSAFDHIMQRLASALCYQSGSWRSLRRVALAFGLLLFSYNTLTSIRADAWPNIIIPHDRLWAQLRPYEPVDAVIKPYTVAITLKDPVSIITPCNGRDGDVCLPPALSTQLTMDRDRRGVLWSGTLSSEDEEELAELWPGAEWQQAVQSLAQLKNRGFSSGILLPLEKWDTDLRQAPLSWWATRIWVLLLGYAILPLAALRVFNILTSVWRLAKALAQADMLKANPYSYASRKSLELIVATCFGANYCLIVISAMVVMGFLKVGSKAEWHDLAFLVLIPLFAYAAVAPLLSMSTIFEHHVKERYLGVHVTAVDQMHQDFHAMTAGMTDENREKAVDAVTKYDDYLSRGQSAAVFPLSVTTITKLVAPVAPLLLALVEKAAGRFF